MSTNDEFGFYAKTNNKAISLIPWNDNRDVIVFDLSSFKWNKPNNFLKIREQKLFSISQYNDMHWYGKFTWAGGDGTVVGTYIDIINSKTAGFRRFYRFGGSFDYINTDEQELTLVIDRRK